jgi:hypothetical protein
MKILKILSAATLVIASSLSQAETKLFEANNINSFGSNIYPSLDLNGLDKIKISINKSESQNEPMPTLEIKRVEFSFPHANNLIASNFTKIANSSDTYRAVVTSPWIFKKVMVEIISYEFLERTRFSYQVFIMDSTSNINNIEQTPGFGLFGGDAELIDVSPNKVVDVVRTNFLGKPLTLRLLDKASPEGVKIEAIWMGHGTEILTLQSTVYPELKPVALVLTQVSDPVADEQRIKARFDDAYYGPETPEESLRFLLEQAFGSLPQE